MGLHLVKEKLITEIEELKGELEEEMTKFLEGGEDNYQTVLEVSEKLDLLIVNYLSLGR